MTHLLVTNDFPPKLGGIQSYLWELWRRLPPESFQVMTRSHPEAASFDAEQPFTVERVNAPVLLPTPALARRIRAAAARAEADLVVLDPVLPLGLVGPHLGIPYAVVAHGAEVTVPGRLPAGRAALAHVLGRAAWAVVGGNYAASELCRVSGGRLPVTVIPPGVDTARFVPLDATRRTGARARFRLDGDGPVVLSVSRLVPRKGMDTLVGAASLLASRHPGLHVVIAGQGRDRARLVLSAVRSGAPVRMLGAVSNDDLPVLYGCADVFAMLCRKRWLGLEQEGFGIVFLEAASSGVPQVAGDSGGAAEAVLDGETGTVLHRPGDAGLAAAAISALLDDDARRERMGAGARARAVAEFDYGALSLRLAAALAEAGG